MSRILSLAVEIVEEIVSQVHALIPERRSTFKESKISHHGRQILTFLDTLGSTQESTYTIVVAQVHITFLGGV